MSICAEAMTGASIALPAMQRLKISAFPPFFIFTAPPESDEKSRSFKHQRSSLIVG
jgi:hypothetical protein